MRLRQRIEEERRIVVLREVPGVPREPPGEQFELVYFVRARRLRVYLLHEQDIRPLLAELGAYLHDVRRDALFAPAPRLRPAVHEEAVVVLVRAEAYVPRDYLILAAGQRRGAVLDGAGDLELDVVGQAVVGYEDVDDVGDR